MSRRRTPQEIPLQLQRQWLIALRERWERINRSELDGRLKAPLFALDDATQRLGRWDPTTRTLGVSLDHMIANTWLEVELTLRHEMAHQVVYELFGAAQAAPHGALFQRACVLLGIEGSPRAKHGLNVHEKRLLGRVRKLFNLASSTNVHEAQAALAAANRLMLQHNLKKLDVNASQESYGFRWLGRPLGRIPLEQKLVGSVLQDFFFVQCIWLRTGLLQGDKVGSVLEIVGQQHNLVLAEHVHGVLVEALNRLWLAYREAAPKERRGRAVRNAYRIGVMMGFREQLEQQRSECSEQGLVWMGEPGLDDFFGRRHPRTQRLRGGRYRTSGAHKDGRRDGLRLRIRPVFDGSSPRRRGNLLSA